MLRDMKREVARLPLVFVFAVLLFGKVLHLILVPEILEKNIFLHVFWFLVEKYGLENDDKQPQINNDLRKIG